MDIEQMAIARLKEAAHMSEKYYHAPLIVTTSGGKDSSVCVALAQRAKVNFEVMHNLTTADAPETVWFVRAEFKRLEGLGVKCVTNFPYYKGRRTSMWNLIPQKLMPPTRLVRYCCSVLKEQGGANRYITTGVRWAESVLRKKNRGVQEAGRDLILNNDNDDARRLFERCELKAKAVCNPIIDWTDADVWEYIRAEKIPVNPLYDCGFSRVGCIGCPMSGRRGREKEFAMWPKYRLMYIAAFGRMLKERERRGKLKGNLRWGDTPEEIFYWWMNYDVLPGQVSLFTEDAP